MANIRKLQENTAALYKISCETLLFYPASKFRTWTSGWKCAAAECNGGSRVQMAAHIRVQKWRQPGVTPIRICGSDALQWCIWMPCPGILLAWIPKNSPPSQICFGDQKAIKTPKLNILWLELIARVLNMPIELKGDNYYSKVFKRVSYKLWNNTFWVVITFLEAFKEKEIIWILE